MGILRTTATGFLAVLVFTLMVGLAWPAAVWAVSRVTADAADGSLVTDGGDCVIASRPLADGREGPGWFRSRPEGGTNLSQSDPGLAAEVAARRAAIAAEEGVDPSAVPADALTGSGSGADAGISPAYADLQIPRVARETGVPEDRLRELVAEHTSGRALLVLGEPSVNVTELNLDLPGGRRCPEPAAG